MNKQGYRTSIYTSPTLGACPERIKKSTFMIPAGTSPGIPISLGVEERSISYCLCEFQ